MISESFQWSLLHCFRPWQQRAQELPGGPKTSSPKLRNTPKPTPKPEAPKAQRLNFLSPKAQNLQLPQPLSEAPRSEVPLPPDLDARVPRCNAATYGGSPFRTRRPVLVQGYYIFTRRLLYITTRLLYGYYTMSHCLGAFEP